LEGILNHKDTKITKETQRRIVIEPQRHRDTEVFEVGKVLRVVGGYSKARG
jgi:hypothetical protein